MTRVIVAEGCRELDAGGVRHYARGGQKGYLQGGSFDVADSAVKGIVAIGGAVASLAGTAASGTGWICRACGFRAWIRTCSRCGGECERQ